MANDVATPLGLRTGTAVEGRLRRHQLAVPRAFNVDVRLELWSQSQTALASLVDDLGRVTGLRTGFVTFPSLLAEDALPGATTVRLLSQGEPVSRDSLALIEAGAGLRDRVTGRVVTAAPAALLATPPRIRLAQSETAVLVISPTPLIPDPLDQDDVAPRGAAITVGFAAEGALAAGQTFRVARLARGATTALQLDVAVIAAAGNELQIELTARADFTGPPAAQAVTTWTEIEAARLSAGIVVHAVVNGADGVIELYLDGDARPESAAPAPVARTGRPAGGRDFELTLGNAAQQNPRALAFTHCHVYAEPVGPLDPRVREMTIGAGRITPGARLRFAPTDNGYTPAPGKLRAETTVVSVDGDVVTVSPPVEDRWPSGRTLLFQDELFFQPSDLRRRDDLVNQIYRLSADYRVAALLDADTPARTAPLAERLETLVNTKSAARGGLIGIPGVHVREK